MSNLEIIWHSPAYDPSGYASCARDYMLALDRAGVKVRFEPVTFWSPIEKPATSGEDYKRLKELESVEVSSDCIHVTHMVPDLYKRRNDKHMSVGYTVFETDSLPSAWLPKMDLMQEIWCPSNFNYNTFCKAGFDKNKIRIIPHISPTERLDPSKYEPLDIPIKKDFYFLTIMDVTHRKGYDLLLKAYLREFKGDKNVGLIFKGYFGGVHENQKRALIKRIRDFREALDIKNPPDIIFFGDILDNNDLPRLYKSAHCYVLPHRGEGYGLTMAEAMSMELPTISTSQSGNCEYMNPSNSFLIDVLEWRIIDDEMTKITPNYKGQKFAEPSEVSLRQHMRYVYEHYSEAKQKGIKARQDLIQNFSAKVITDKIKVAIRELQNV